MATKWKNMAADKNQRIILYFFLAKIIQKFLLKRNPLLKNVAKYYINNTKKVNIFVIHFLNGIP